MKQQKRYTTKRILSWVMALVMVCTVMAGVTIGSPTYVAEAAVSKYTTPITEKAEEATTWKFLFVVPLQATYTETDAEGNVTKQLAGATFTSDDITLFEDYIVPNFEAAIAEYSLGHMKVESTIVTIETLPLAKTGEGEYEEHYPTAEVVEAALKDGPRTDNGAYGDITVVSGSFNGNFGSFDQVCCCYSAENPEDENKSLAFLGAGLGGGRFTDYVAGYTITRLEPGMELDDTNKAWKTQEKPFINADGSFAYYYFSELLVHEFIHCLEFWVKFYYPSWLTREMPSPDECWTYYKKPADESTFSLMNDFYINFFRGNVPVSKKNTKNKWGMAPEDYTRNPSKYQGVAIGTETISTLEEWNDLCLRIAFGADTAGARITLNANIDARGKTIYNIPEFEGTLDGAGYAIIGAAFEEHGLIDVLTKDAAVSNLLLIGASLTNKTAYAAGLLAGTNYGTITGCGVTGTITGGDFAGGIVGVNQVTKNSEDVIESKGSITNCFNGAMVTTSAFSAGGIAGWNEAAIANCYNYGWIAGTKTTHSASGICGGSGAVATCYSLSGSTKNDANTDGISIMTSAQMGSAEFAEELNKNADGSVFAAGNSYPVFASAKYVYVTNGGSTLELADEETEVDEIVWAGGPATKLVTTLKATKWLSGTKVKSGAITWIIKNEPTEIEFNTATHKVTTKSDTTIATVSKGTVKGKAEGVAYVYAIDTGSMTAEAFKIQVKAAPATIGLYHGNDVDSLESYTAQYTSEIVPEGGTVRVYYKGIVGAAKAGTWDVLDNDELTYIVGVPLKQVIYLDYDCIEYVDYGSHMAGEDQEEDRNYFEVTINEGILEKFGKNGKVTLSFIVVNEQNGKRTTFKTIVSNLVKDITLSAVGDTAVVEKVVDKDTQEVTTPFTVVLPDASTEAQAGTIKETVTTYMDGERKDGTKVIRIPHPEEYGFSSNGTITLNGKLTADQKKVSMTYNKATNEYTVKAKKGTRPGTEAYFIIWHNSFGRTAGTGYEIVKVVVGEAVPVTSMEFTAKSGEGINANVTVIPEETTDNIEVFMPMPEGKSASTAYLKETITVEGKEADPTPAPTSAPRPETTDYTTIYKLPYGTEEAFNISNNGVVSVLGALSAGQKKVSMSYNAKDDEYTIKAAKGTPEGTEAYFLVYHNPEVWSIVSVTVGTPNKVAKSEIATTNDTVKLTTEELGEGTMTVVTVPYSESKQAVVLTEKTTLENPAEGAKATDVTKVVRIPTEESFEVALNKSTVTADGILTAAQKKISMALQKKTTDTFNLTVAAKTPVGTETYFIVYHNDEVRESGTGYHIVKVVVAEKVEADPTPEPTEAPAEQ